MAKNAGYNPNAYVYSSGSPKYYAGVKQAMGKPPSKPVGNPVEKPTGAPVKPPVKPPVATAPSNPYGLDPAVYSAISPQLTYLNQVQAQNQAALEGLTKAIMSQLGGISGQVGQNYDQGIQQQQALAQAGADSLRQANGNAGIQSILGAIGAPASQQQQIANNLGQVFNGGAAATFGLQGTLPVTRLIGDKLLQQNFASELPGIQSVAATNALKNLLASSNNEKLKVLAQVPQIQSDLAKSKMDQQKFALDQQKAASDKFFKNANLGLAKRKDAYNEWLGQKKLGLAAYNQSFNQWAKTQGLKFQGQKVAIAQQNANTAATRAAQSFDAQLQRIGIAREHLSLDQQKLVQQAAVSAQKAKRGGFTPYQMSKFRSTANRIAANAFAGVEDPKNPGKFLAPPLKDDPNGFQKALLEMFQPKSGGAVPLQVALKALNKYWKVPGQGGRPFQELPLRQRLKKGKADAAQGAAYNVTKFVTVAPGANRAGVPLQPGVIDFVGRIGQLAGRKLTIGTGSNHNEYVVGTNRVSAHWAGRAADVPASGSALTKLGQDALIAAGADPRWARQQTGGLFNVGGYQVIFNSDIGGNHYNHLHVGLQGGTV